MVELWGIGQVGQVRVDTQGHKPVATEHLTRTNLQVG